MVVGNPDALSQVARNRYDDEIYARFRETAEILTNSNWDSFVNTEQFCALRNGHAQQLSIHSILKPQVLIDFASVTMTSANFCDGLIYKLWGKMGVKFVEDVSLTKDLRFQDHCNGPSTTIKYLTDLPWSQRLMARKNDFDEEDGPTVESAFIEAVKTEFGEQRFLWQVNKSVTTDPFGGNAKRLPNVPHGLNDYSEFDRICFLSALNPKTDHFKFLESRGLSSNDVRQAVYCSAVYQSVMRSSIRDPNNMNPKTVIVPDVHAAKYLRKLFPGSRIEKLKTQISEQPVIVGRPREYKSDAERTASHRQRKKLKKLKNIVQTASFRPYPSRTVVVQSNHQAKKM